jgi:hypothetical protein
VVLLGRQNPSSSTGVRALDWASKRLSSTPKMLLSMSQSSPSIHQAEAHPNSTELNVTNRVERIGLNTKRLGTRPWLAFSSRAKKRDNGWIQWMSYLVCVCEEGFRFAVRLFQCSLNRSLFVVDEFQEIGWKILDFDNFIAAEDEAMPNPRPAFELEDWQIECPAIVFVYAADNSTAQYDCVKMFSDFQFGVQCQYIVQEKCAAQGRRIGQ